MENKTAMLYVRMTPQQAAKLVQVAKAETGGNLSEVARRAIEAYVDARDTPINGGDDV